MAGNSYRKIDAVRKACEILKYVADQKTPVNGPDIARAVNLPLGTVMSQLMTMEECGFIRQIAGDGFEIGMGAALVWARKKSLLEGTRDQAVRDIKTLEEGK